MNSAKFFGRTGLHLPDVPPPTGTIIRQDRHRLGSRQFRRLDVLPLREGSPVGFLRGLSDPILADLDLHEDIYIPSWTFLTFAVIEFAMAQPPEGETPCPPP